ncbi:hypothetical protein GCM10008931_42720 [Oceanobacillus oncorhynchi subsp. oncorhynchi]|uniref:helix-turn-helix domain-containing protein n=1 Tax=Oceanobacillus oncorhynchi TaxID=545501 RepID=UPI0031D88FC5
MTKATTIGHRIKTIRENYNLSQEDFAKRINIPSEKLNSWENNNSIPAAKPIFAIINEFNVSSDWLLYGEKYINPIEGENLTSIHLKLINFLEEEQEDFDKDLNDYKLSKIEQHLIETFRDLEYKKQEEILKMIDKKLDE